MDAACLALAAIGRAVLPLIAPAELAERAALLELGALGDGDARRTLNDLELLAGTAIAASRAGERAAARAPGEIANFSLRSLSQTAQAT